MFVACVHGASLSPLWFVSLQVGEVFPELDSQGQDIYCRECLCRPDYRVECYHENSTEW